MIFGLDLIPLNISSFILSKELILMTSNFSHPEKMLSILVVFSVLIGDRLISFSSVQFSKVCDISIKFGVFIPSK